MFWELLAPLLTYLGPALTPVEITVPYFSVLLEGGDVLGAAGPPSHLPGSSPHPGPVLASPSLLHR
jgi:hypothetical protein